MNWAADDAATICGADPQVRSGPPGPLVEWFIEAGRGARRGPGGPPHNCAVAYRVCRRGYFFLILSAALLCGEVLDRIAVVVRKHVIAESEVLRDLRVSAFLDQAPLDLSPEKKRKAAARLVDQFLILEEAAFSHFALPTEEDAEELLGHVKSQYASDAEYRAALARYRVSEPEVIAQLLDGLRTSRFTDLRFRPEIQPSDDDLHDFYNTLVDQWKKENRKDIPTFEESRSTVERLLVEQRSMQALDRWLGATRTETRILYREEVFK